MKRLAATANSRFVVSALDRAVAPGGASALDGTVPEAVWRRALLDPAAIFLARPGKNLRTTLVKAGWMLGGRAIGEMPEQLSLVVELLHAGSLIIDDVEDGSDVRRGAPALHRVVGTPLAINTGSWMYFWALGELGALALPTATALAAHRAAATTLVRCHQGQALDLATRVSDLAPVDVGAVVAATTRLKTGALCRFAAELGALAAGAETPMIESLGRFGEAMGVGLQMLDDLGSLASEARRDKGRDDLRNDRPTWPWAWLAEIQPFAWARFTGSANAVVTGNGDPDRLAAELVEIIGATGRGRVRTCLDDALEEFQRVNGPSTVLSALEAELRRMEASYG